jgi:hypothetical protein
MAGVPSAVIRSGSSITGGEHTQSRSLAGQSQFQTQATTGAMGPSSRSPLVWVGALLSLCVLVLAGAIVWTRMEKGQPTAASQTSASREGLAGSPGPKPAGTAGSTHPSATGAAASSGTAGNAAASQENSTVLASTTLRQEQAQAAARREAEIRRAEQLALQRVREQRERDRLTRIRQPQQEERPTVATPPKAPELPQVGRILIKSAPPFAALTINGKPQGETPMSAFIEVPLGRCHIEIVHRLSPPFDTVLNITPGFQREYKFKLDR